MNHFEPNVEVYALLNEAGMNASESADAKHCKHYLALGTCLVEYVNFYSGRLLHTIRERPDVRRLCSAIELVAAVHDLIEDCVRPDAFRFTDMLPNTRLVDWEELDIERREWSEDIAGSGYARQHRREPDLHHELSIFRR